MLLTTSTTPSGYEVGAYNTIAVPIGHKVVGVDRSTTPAKLIMEDGSLWQVDPYSTNYWDEQLQKNINE